MEDISLSSPDSSVSASDSDAYNTESARLYFGPLKTPERKFVDNSKGLFPPIQTTSPHQSPRSSSPHLRLPSQPTDDNEDMDQVAQLISVPSGDEEHYSDSATPQNGDGVEDGPSSVLADRVMHALDNPSPPPSPTLPLSFFDPYHTTTPQSLTDYRNDLFSPSMNSRPENDDVNPSFCTTINSKAQTPETHSNVPSQLLQRDLISFDSVTALQSSKEANGPAPPLLDDLLPHCSISVKSPRIQQTFEIPDLVVESPLENFLVESVAVMDLAQTVESVGESDIVLHNSKPQASQLGGHHVLPQPSNLETPVRRSPRPQMSVTPNLVPPPAVFSLPPSGARTQIKKLTTSDKSINDPQERDIEEEVVQQPLSQTTHGALWSARQRSPTRSPMSFNRVLGSLSPQSTDLLSKLAFTPTEEPNNNTSIGDADPSSNSRTPFTFSMFPTSPEHVPPKTPFRSTGPIRFSSPTRSTSPHKIRLQTPVPNGPMNTPARRIPIEQGISQGHVSPQKAAQLGFKSDGTPLTYIPTPARRVLVSEHLTIPVTRPGSIRLGSPSKGKEREPSIEPISRPVVTMRMDKEETSRASSTETPAKSLSVQPNRLPFPLVASNPVPPTSSPIVPGILQNRTEAKSADVKSSLRQPTSRIPRIGTKPYSRPPALKSREKDHTLSKKTVGLAKNSLQKSTTMESAPIPPSVGRTATSSVSRVKPTVSTSTSLLKRKREVEKLSPVKPRIIALRQVPKVVLSTTSSSKTRLEPTTVPNLKATSQNSTLRPSRGMDAKLARVPRSIPQGHEAPGVVYNSRHAETVMESPETRETSPPLPPGSPMMQDPPDLPHSVLEPQLKPELIPPDKIPTTDASSASNLRRTTRSRRTPVGEGNSRPLPTRRKPAATRSDDVFSGMSITALKDLTISNTTRNQQYLIAKLEMEVVRKEGARPESPAVKIRTIVQRKTEEKLKERTERAIRRARRSDGDMTSSDIEGYSDAGYSSPCEDRSEQSTLVKHRRGPGDEEEYETPDRHKTKLFVEADNQGGEPKRRVKWDRGLFTTVYLDEVKLGTRQPLKENRSLKGILAPTAKALRLDTLGNLPQADLPLTDLVQENITIKKYVYDDDDVPAPELIVVKNTRSKSKKTRS